MFRGLKQPIPKHIYDQAKAARLGRPDFYVGPTVPKTLPDRKPGDTSRGADADIEDHMSRLRKQDDEALENAKEVKKKANGEKRDLEKESRPGFSNFVKLLQRRFSFIRHRGARQPNAPI